MTRRRRKIQKRIRKLDDGEFRERCYGCYRPIDRCFCDTIPPVDNLTDVLILQHQRERTHPFNTARIVQQSLAKCRLMFDRNERFADAELPIASGAGLLYPGPDSRLLSELSPAERPSQLVILDGTWHHAKTLFRDIPQLRELPRYKLAPSTPGQYRIRLEPTDTSLSTLEATVQALQQLEPETDGLEQLLDSFNTMVEQQLAHPDANYTAERKRPNKININVPQTLCGDLSRVVVAYGEPMPTKYQSDEGWKKFNQQRSQSSLPPVYWVARRLGDDSVEGQFAETIEPVSPIAQKFLGYMELASEDFANAISVEEFRTRWNQFCRPDDLLVVHNQSTVRLLTLAAGPPARVELLKPINHDPAGEYLGLADFFKAHSVEQAEAFCPGRAGKRLANAVTLVRCLNKIGNSINSVSID